ncbi:MAG: hypothetical protein ABIA78_00430 [archaeon]
MWYENRENTENLGRYLRDIRKRIFPNRNEVILAMCGNGLAHYSPGGTLKTSVGDIEKGLLFFLSIRKEPQTSIFCIYVRCLNLSQGHKKTLSEMLGGEILILPQMNLS